MNTTSTLTKIFGALVPTFFTTEGGVSLSEVSRLQAENKQANDRFASRMTDATNGIFREELSFVGAGAGQPQEVPGTTVAPEEIGGYAGVAERNAQTAVLMHAVKLHKGLEERLQEMDLRLYVADSLPTAPTAPPRAKLGSTCDTDRFMAMGSIDEMAAALNPEVLERFDFGFFRRAQELNARAAVLGKLLSENGSFFRKLVAPLPAGSKQTVSTDIRRIFLRRLKNLG